MARQERSYIRVETFGDWIKVRDTLRWYERRAMHEVQDLIYKEMEDSKDVLKMMIEDQSIPMEKLSAKWEKYKVTHNFDPRILIMTGDYLDSFRVVRKGKRTWTLIPEGHEELAAWLEHGTADMPARPHWIYVRQEMEGSIRSSVQDLFRKKGKAK